MTNNWLITGATSGFGRRVAERALQNGAHVIAVGRRAADLPARAGLTPLALDITAPEAEEVLRAAVDVAGGLDVLVNNAGYGLFGSVEQTPAAEERAVIDTTCWPTWPCCGPPCPPCAPRTAGSCRLAR